MTAARNQQVQRTILFFTIVLILCLMLEVKAARISEQIDQSNLPEWAGGWTHVNPNGEGRATMWQTFTPAYTNVIAVEIDILTINPGRGDDVLTIEIAKDGDILASADCSVEDGFDGLLRFNFPEAVTLVPEQVYELTVRDTGKTRFGWKYASNTYERGSRYVFAEERPGTDWFFCTYAKVNLAPAEYGGGTGEPNDPYLIYTAEQLNEIGLHEEDWDKHFELKSDIDLSAFTGTNFNIIGVFPGVPFSGVFDGSGKRISNFGYKTTDTDCIGLFGYIVGQGEEGTIKNLRLIDPNVEGGTGNCVGSLIGWLRGGTVTACSVEGGIVSGNNFIGGFIGEHDFEAESSPPPLPIPPPYTISSCSSSAVVVGRVHVGGLVGSNSGLVTRCYSGGTVKGDNQVGGLVGTNYRCYDGFCFSGSVYHSYSTSMVTGDEFVGGLVGNGVSDEVINSFWDIQTSGQQTSDGGTSKTTDEMQTASTFLEAGWDFMEESENGTEDIWWILEDQSYPRLWWQYGLTFSPHPRDSATDVAQPLILSWLPGGLGLWHDIYFGEDKEAVVNATTESTGIYRGRQAPEITTYDPGLLELDKTYYWRVDELDSQGSTMKGPLWSFTTADFFVVDDFESYDDDDNFIWNTWVDGFGDPNNGSIVGDLLPPYWHVIVHSGQQSMPFHYDNSFSINYSEATAHTAYFAIGHDWTTGDVTTLSLWFRGSLANGPEPMYVALANANGSAAMVYHEDPNAALIDIWAEWRIPLVQFSSQGVDLTLVTWISIGFGDKNNPPSGGSGQMYFDDIRLYRPRSIASPCLEVNKL